MHSLKKQMISVGLALILLFSFSACAASGGGPRESSEASTQAESGESTASTGEENSDQPEQPQESVVSYAVSTFPDSLDSAVTLSLFDAEILYHTSEGLVRLYQNTVQPGIAQRWEVDGAQYTFHLRDAVWEDGQPVTADDFVYAFRRALDPQVNPSLIGGLLSIKNALAYRSGNADVSALGMEAPDDQTLVLTLESESPYFLNMLASDSHAYPVRQDAVETYGSDYAKSAAAYLSCGPFRLQSWDEETITMVRNDTYWDADKIHLEKLVCKLVPDGATRALMYESGELNAYIEFLKSNSTYYTDAKSACGNTLISLQVNMETEALANDDFRKALSQAIDRQTLVSGAATGGSEATNRFVSSIVSGSSGAYTAAYPMQGTALSGDLTAAKTSLQTALQALALDKAPTLRFVCHDTAAAVPVAEALVDYWKQLGLTDVQLECLPAEEAITRCREKDYDLYLQVNNAAYLDPYAHLSQWTSNAAYNWTGWADETYDTMLEETNHLQNETERFQKLGECEQYLIDHGPQIPLYFRGYLYGAKENVTGISASGVGVGLEMLYAEVS